VFLEGGGYCGEGRITADLNGDQGIYGSVHNGPRFDTLSLSFALCEALCASYDGCMGFSWKPERGLHLDGNCVMRGDICTSATVVPTDMKFYAKRAREDTPTPPGYRHLEGDCATEDVTASLSFPHDAIQKYVIGTAQVDVGLAARCCEAPHDPCGSKSYTAPQNWMISKENWFKSSGTDALTRIPALGLSLTANGDVQQPPVKLGLDILSVELVGGGSCGEGRITADLNGDQGVSGDVHNGARFDTVSLTLEDCAAWCNSFPTCAGFSWKRERDLMLDGNCVLRSSACTSGAVVTTDMTFYAKGALP